jgi:hypothetical protein
MQRQSAWVLVVFGWSRDFQAFGVVCSGVGRVLLAQQRPPGGDCRFWPIQHQVTLVAGTTLTNRSASRKCG